MPDIKMPDGARAVMPDSPLMNEISDITIGDLIALTQDIAFSMGMNSDDFNEKNAQIVMDVNKRCVDIEGGTVDAAGIKAMARGLHVALCLITSALFSIKEAVGVMELREDME